MDIRFSQSEEAFREDVRTFLKASLPMRIAEKVRLGQRLTKRDMEDWHAILDERGWYANRWPKEYGGPGWNVVEAHIFDVETSLAHAPRIVPFGVSMLGPVLIKYASEEQKRYWLPRIRSGADWWCQGYSEPGAGSDLASLKTSAIRDGDHYVVNGQKTWTTLAQHANMIFCLVRTSTARKKQEGISFLLIDMNSPGVEVRPITLLDGGREVNEVFLTDVRVPIENLVGEENKGWTYAKYLLTHERSNIAGVGDAIAEMVALKRITQSEYRNGRPLCKDPIFAARVARIEIDLHNLRTTNLRVLLANGDGTAPMAETAMLKIRGTEIRQQILGLTRRALGAYARPFVSEALEEGFTGEPVGPDYAASISAHYFNHRKLSIFGGSNEVQREIIAKSLLEL